MDLHEDPVDADAIAPRRDETSSWGYGTHNALRAMPPTPPETGARSRRACGIEVSR
jgi:hypothetical protein